MQLRDLRIFTEPQQGASYEDLLAVARRAELLGFGAFFRSDHYLSMGGDGLPGPSDAWITLAGLARDTTSIRLGTLVTSATFRMPGPLAIAVAGVDQMSGGRVELGLGAGWFQAEHTAYGIPFPSVRERFDNLSEQLEILHALWNTPTGERVDYAGTRWQLTDSPALPKPAQPGGPPIIIGGKGKRRTPELTARFAAECNVPFVDVADFRAQCDRVRAVCEHLDRDPDSLIYSTASPICCGENEAEIARRAEAAGIDLAERRADTLTGTPGEVVEKIQAFQAAGAGRLYVQMLDLSDLAHLDLVAERVAPHL